MGRENWNRAVTVNKILLVDDDQDALEELKDIVELEGWDAKTASSVDAALEILAADPDIGVVVSDFYFALDNGEDTNGAQFVSRAQARFADRKMAFVILSGDPSVLKSSVQVGAVKFLSKPFLADDFILAVETARFSTVLDDNLSNVSQRLIAI